jgi:hypothetical protein
VIPVMSVFYEHLQIFQRLQGAADIARSSQLSSSLSGQAVWPAMAGGSAFHHSTNQVSSILSSQLG